MKNILEHIISNRKKGKKLLAVLIDPDKVSLDTVPHFLTKVNNSLATHIFVGGSSVKTNITEKVVTKIKEYSNLPIVLFPGDTTQITNKADAILFLSLISGRNAEYLIGKHVEAVSELSKIKLEIIPTGYILIENGKQTAVERISNTTPMKRDNLELIKDTAKAGEFLGMKLIYLEAGSGALHPIDPEIISKVKKTLNIPLIVGGGIRTMSTLQSTYNAGADLVVIGTALEQDESFFNHITNTHENIC